MINVKTAKVTFCVGKPELKAQISNRYLIRETFKEYNCESGIDIFTIIVLVFIKLVPDSSNKSQKNIYKTSRTLVKKPKSKNRTQSGNDFVVNKMSFAW